MEELSDLRTALHHYERELIDNRCRKDFTHSGPRREQRRQLWRSMVRSLLGRYVRLLPRSDTAASLSVEVRVPPVAVDPLGSNVVMPVAGVVAEESPLSKRTQCLRH